jgi:uncharacterized Fe-S center protein
VNDIHKKGGTVLGTSRGGHDTKKIVDNIQDRGINQVNMTIQMHHCDTAVLTGHMNSHARICYLGIYHWRRWNSEGSI